VSALSLLAGGPEGVGEDVGGLEEAPEISEFERERLEEPRR